MLFHDHSGKPISLNVEGLPEARRIEDLSAPSLTPEERLARDRVISLTNAQISSNANLLREGGTLEFSVRPFVRSAIVSQADLMLDREWYLYEARSSGIPIADSCALVIPTSAPLQVVHLPSALSLLWEELISKREQLDGLLESNPLFYAPLIKDPGIELCALLNDKLGIDYALAEFKASPGAPLNFVLRKVSGEERSNREKYLPLNNAWRETKGLIL